MSTSQWKMAILGAGMAGLLAAWPVFAGTTVHTTAAGDWNSTATWVGSYIPQDGDTAVVDHNITLTNATASLAACTISAGKTNTFCTTNAVLNAQQVSVYGTLTHTNNSATTTNVLGQWIPNGLVSIVCSNLFVDAAGSINTDTRGYAGAAASSASNGRGPGGGGQAGGGGYGGLGGTPNGGTVNGIASAPSQPGSGGGASGSSDAAGAGGGLIWIQATQGTVTVNGRISANGAFLTAPGGGTGHAGGGSGGGIYIACNTFAGTNGTMSASGGIPQRWTSGGGGGGRIAVVCNPGAQSNAAPVSVQFLCGGALGMDGGGNGAPGTIYVTSSQILPAVWANSGGVLQGFPSWAPLQLAITNSQLSFAARVQISVTNSISLAGSTSSTGLLLTNASTLQCGGNLSINNASVNLYPDTDTTPPNLVVNGNLSLVNTGLLYVSAAFTNATSPTGAWVNVGGAMTMANGSFVYPSCNATNGGGVAFTVGSLSIADAASGFNADGKGYAGARANSAANGWGPGGGGQSIGGGYGGLGGGGGATYGVASAPYQPGSGGGAAGSSDAAGAGGGLIWIQATQGAVTVNGRLSANGTYLTPPGGGTGHAGGGSGGGIYISCNTFAATNGTLSALGGRPQPYGSGGGGGGRIAVVYDPAAQSNAAPVSAQFLCGGAPGDGASSGGPGSLYVTSAQFLPSVWTGTVMSAVLMGFSSWTPAQLAITNSMVSIGTRAQISVTNNISISGTTNSAGLILTNACSLTCAGNVSISNASLSLAPDVDATPPTLVVNGNLSLMNTGKLYVSAAMTNPPAQTTGAWVNVIGAMSLTNGSIVYPFCNPTNGGGVVFTVNSLAINDTNSGFNADGRGFRGTLVGVKTNGLGPGGGKFGNGGGGGGYGGAGGASSGAAGGGTYGFSNIPPVYAGSGGGNGVDGTSAGGNGGGVIWIEAGKTITLNGYLSASSGAMVGPNGNGGGSGGGIYLKCRTILGTTGSLIANGGNGGDWGGSCDGGGGGGGGRIQVWSMYNMTGGALTASVQKGSAIAGHRGSDGAVGTVYWGQLSITRGITLLFR